MITEKVAIESGSFFGAFLTRFSLALLVAAVCFAGSCSGDGRQNGRNGGEKDAASGSPGAFVRVLGTVQDGGLPHAACTCSHCEAARHDPARRRWVACLAVCFPSEGRALLIDATPDIRTQLDQVRDVGQHPDGRTDRHPVDGVLLTHAHIGHLIGLAFFGFEAVHTKDLPVFCTPRMAVFLRSNGPWDLLVQRREIVLREQQPGASFPMGPGVTATSLAVPHRDEHSDTVGYFLRGPRSSLLYVPDTDSWRAWTRPLPEALEGVDVAILDGTFYSANELPGRDISEVRHPLMTETMSLLGPLVRSGRTRVFFSHLNHSNPALDARGKEIRAIEGRGFHVLEEGQEFAL